MTQLVHRSNLQRLVIILAVVWQIGATFLPALGLGEPIGDRSDSVRTIITPSGWAFAIWGPLFFGSAAFAIWQALPAQKDNALIDRIGWWSALTLAAQGAWATYTQFANLTAISAIIIATSLVALLVIMRVLVAFPRDFTVAERVIVALTFSALAAWLTAATVVNISATLVYYGVAGGFEFPLVGALIVLVAGAIASVAVARSKGNPWYALVFCWALLAIYFRGGQESTAIAAACGLSAALVIGAALTRLRVPPNRRRWFG
uniref:hypothetical protein n=1 Tax=Parerythrobacter lutipelagi TaxID=1964208 RepID=UPI0010F6452A|nr:hypothetical protein [Parerythrobacter lutipelagi]